MVRTLIHEFGANSYTSHVLNVRAGHQGDPEILHHTSSPPSTSSPPGRSMDEQNGRLGFSDLIHGFSRVDVTFV